MFANIRILEEFADNVDVVTVVTLDAVLEWLIFKVADLEVDGLIFEGNEEQIGEDPKVLDFGGPSIGSSKGSGNSDNSSIVEYTSE